MSAGTTIEDAAERLLNLLDSVASTEPAHLAESGKAVLPNTEGPAEVTLAIKGKAAGKIQVGPNADATGGYELPVEVAAGNTAVVTIRVPTDFSIKTTLTEGAISKGILTAV